MVCIGGGGVEVVVVMAGSDAAVVHHRLVNTIIVLVNKKCIGQVKKLTCGPFLPLTVRRPSSQCWRCSLSSF